MACNVPAPALRTAFRTGSIEAAKALSLNLPEPVRQAVQLPAIC
jgi:hypothetical protein